MNELILIRHGESEHHVAGRIGGWSDAALTELGLEQARRTGAWLKAHAPFAPSAIIASDLRRAAETASAIGATLELTPEPEPALRELSSGAACDLPVAEARKLERPRTEPVLDWIPYPDAESWRMMHTRVTHCLAGLRAAGRDRLVLVTHGQAAVSAINWFLGLEREEDLRDLYFVIQPCGITHLRRSADGGRTLALLSDTRHLA
jgi:probable phosphoglycerate mutase